MHREGPTLYQIKARGALLGAGLLVVDIRLLTDIGLGTQALP